MSREILRHVGNVLRNPRKLATAGVAMVALSACSGDSNCDSTARSTVAPPETVIIYLPATTVEATTQTSASATTSESSVVPTSLAPSPSTPGVIIAQPEITTPTSVSVEVAPTTTVAATPETAPTLPPVTNTSEVQPPMPVADCIVSFVGTPYFSQTDVVELVSAGAVTLNHPDGSQPDSNPVRLAGNAGTLVDLNNVEARAKADYTNWAHGAYIQPGTEAVFWNDDASFSNTNPIPSGLGLAARCDVNGQLDLKALSR